MADYNKLVNSGNWPITGSTERKPNATLKNNTSKRRRKSSSLQRDDAQSDTRQDFDQDLQAVVDAWPGLSDDAKAIILAVAGQGESSEVDAV